MPPDEGGSKKETQTMRERDRDQNTPLGEMGRDESMGNNDSRDGSEGYSGRNRNSERGSNIERDEVRSGGTDRTMNRDRGETNH